MRQSKVELNAALYASYLEEIAELEKWIRVPHPEIPAYVKVAVRLRIADLKKRLDIE